jgi:hypothetical protein
LFATEHVDDTCATNSGFHRDEAWMFTDNFTHDGGLPAKRVSAHRGEYPVGNRWRDKANAAAWT